MDHYADDLATLVAHLDLRDAVHVGHSTGGGEVVRYIARHGESRVAKAVLISSVPPLMVKTDANPGIVAFSQTDFTEDLKKITVPVLVMHGDDDQIVPYADSGPLSAELVQNGTLKTYA
jgi:pimeloyl-ACP methyl ester carboxylesterase